MVGAVDIAPLTDTVSIIRPGGNHKLTVRGLEAGTIIGLIANFDEIRRMFETHKFNVASFTQISGPALAYIIKDCVDVKEEHIKNLSLGERIEILTKAFKLTSSRGLDPFVELVGAFGLGVLSDEAPATKSSKPSKNSSRADTPMPGDIRHAS